MLTVFELTKLLRVGSKLVSSGDLSILIVTMLAKSSIVRSRVPFGHIPGEMQPMILLVLSSTPSKA